MSGQPGKFSVFVWLFSGVFLLGASGLMVTLSDDRVIETLGVFLNVIASLILCPVFNLIFNGMTQRDQAAEFAKAVVKELSQKGAAPVGAAVLPAFIALSAVLFDRIGTVTVFALWGAIGLASFGLGSRQRASTKEFDGDDVANPPDSQ